MSDIVERAGGATIADLHRQDVAARARQWAARQAVAPARASRSGPPAAARPAGPKPAARQAVGWIAGCVCPGLSVPVTNSVDSRKVPEHFAPECLRSFVEQSRQRDVELRYGHTGQRIGGTADGSLRFENPWNAEAFTGLDFACRLFDTVLGRQVLEESLADGLGVSIGFIARRSYIAERDVGPVRVILAGEIDHLAVIPPTSGTLPCFRGARAYGAATRSGWCPAEIKTRAQLHAYTVHKPQAWGYSR